MWAAKGLLVASLGMGLLTACGLVADPSEQVFTIRLLNDSDRTVTLSLCDTSCEPPGALRPVTLPPGAATPENESSEQAPNDYVVIDSLTGTRRCFELSFNRKQPGLVVRLSGVRTSAC